MHDVEIGIDAAERGGVSMNGYTVFGPVEYWTGRFGRLRTMAHHGA